ncbi:MAG: hypothetical protein ACR2NM_15045, partial [Bythopirellula sp.]
SRLRLAIGSAIPRGNADSSVAALARNDKSAGMTIALRLLGVTMALRSRGMPIALPLSLRRSVAPSLSFRGRAAPEESGFHSDTLSLLRGSPHYGIEVGYV